MYRGEGLEFDKDVLGGVRGPAPQIRSCRDIIKADYDPLVRAVHSTGGGLEAFQRASRFGVEHLGRAEAVTTLVHRSTILVDGETVPGRAFLRH